jgi:hypothetical protein
MIVGGESAGVATPAPGSSLASAGPASINETIDAIATFFQFMTYLPASSLGTDVQLVLFAEGFCIRHATQPGLMNEELVATDDRRELVGLFRRTAVWWRTERL